jgi:hypothetical protein
MSFVAPRSGESGKQRCRARALRYKGGRRLPKVIVPILLAATLALMAVADLLIVISGLFYFAGKGGGQVALLGIQVGFWTGLCLTCAFVAPPKKGRSLTPVRKQRDRVRDDTKA